MAKWLTTFARGKDFQEAKRILEEAGIKMEVISPEPGYRQVAQPALVVDDNGRSFLEEEREKAAQAGWVEYRPTNLSVPDTAPEVFAEDIFGQAAIVLLAPCVADETKIRLIAHLTGNISVALPYLNAVRENASYIKNGPVLTLMEGYRFISLQPLRISIARADDIIDGWRLLEKIRVEINRVWQKRNQIQPSEVLRQRPPALEILKRLPRLNCQACGEKTCIAFAWKVYQGTAKVTECRPVFNGEYSHLKEALLEICRGLGTL
ncbi:MAG: hypothetical protein NC911_01565 [Candidatus Omnitrophica bacterium]|nr:hypothetical protein [Candidatus Omnitrophota bacterium]